MAKSKRPDSKLETLRASGALNPRSAKVTDQLFQEREFFDPRDLVQVRYEMLRRVQKEGQDVAQVAEAFGLSRPSFYKAKERFQAEGLFGLLPQKRGPKGRHKLSADVLAFAQEARIKDAALDGRALARLIHARFGIHVHPRTVERAMAESKKKNWLFAGSDQGGEHAAILYSMIESAKRNGVEPQAYLTDLFTRIPNARMSELEKFLPDRWKPPNTS